MKIVLSLVVAAVLLGIAYQQRATEPVAQHSAAAAIKAAVYTLRTEPFHDRIEALGTLVGNESITLTATTSDVVKGIHFEEGQHVERDQLLITLVDDEEQAQLQSARADLAEQQREVRRLSGLVNSMSAAQTELDQRRSDQARAQHKIEELEARIRDRQIRAPFAGVLGLRMISIGALVSPGTTITTLDDIATLKLDFSVPATLMRNLTVGQELEAFSAAYKERFLGKIRVIDSRVNPVDRSIRARAEFDNRDGKLKPGMLMQIDLIQNPRQTLLVPEQAILSQGQSHSVWLVDADKRLQQRDVRLGGRKPGWVEITEGLTAGDTIVAAHFPRLRQGVTIAPAGPVGSP